MGIFCAIWLIGLLLNNFDIRFHLACKLTISVETDGASIHSTFSRSPLVSM